MSNIEKEQRIKQLIEDEEKRKEYNRQKDKEYREKNKEQINQKGREYYIENIEHKKQYNMEYREKNKEYINQVITCDICGCQATRKHITRHQSTNKCKKSHLPTS